MLWTSRGSHTLLRAGVILYLPWVKATSAPLLPQVTRCLSASPPQLPPDIDFEELKHKLYANEVTLIDVRMPGEQQTEGMIPHSKNIALTWLGSTLLQPDEEFAEDQGFSKPGTDDPLVVSCLAGIRARTAQLAFMGAGYHNVRVYVGSFEDWVAKGGKVVFPNDSTNAE